MNIQSVLDYVQDKSGHPLYADEGLMLGHPDRKIAKLFFCWMADATAIKTAASKGCSHIVAHESVFHPNGAYERERVLEWVVCRTLFKARPDVRAIIHSHPPRTSGFAIARGANRPPAREWL